MYIACFVGLLPFCPETVLLFFITIIITVRDSTKATYSPKPMTYKLWSSRHI